MITDEEIFMRNYLLSIHSVMLLVMLAILSACKLDPSVAVSAGKSTPASLSLTGHELGVRETGEEFDFSITLKNNGNVAAKELKLITQLSTPFTFKDGEYPGTGGDCHNQVAGNDECTIVVTFKSEEDGEYLTDLSFSYNDGVEIKKSANTLRLQTKTKAKLVVRTMTEEDQLTSFNFGIKSLGTSHLQTLYLVNEGSFDATIIATPVMSAPIIYNGNGVFPGLGGSCGGIVAGNSSCSIIVAFAPEVVGPEARNLNLQYSDGVGNITTLGYAIFGISANLRGNIVFDDGEAYQLGNYPINTPSNGYVYQVVVNNTREIDSINLTASLSNLSDFSFLGGSYPGLGGNCSTTLASQSNCSIFLSFHPQSLGIKESILRIDFNDNNELDPQNSFSQIIYSGNGVNPGNLQVTLESPSTVFELLESGGVESKTFMLRNVGSYKVSDIRAGEMPSPFLWDGGTCFATNALIAPNGTCTIVVKFAPTIAGSFSTPLPLIYNGGQGETSTSAIIISGSSSAVGKLTTTHSEIGTDLVIPPSMFGAITSDYTITLENIGEAVASEITFPLATDIAPFEVVSNNCGTALNAGASCQFVIHFSPTTAGQYTRSFYINYNNQIRLSSRLFSLVSSALSAATFDLSPTTLDLKGANVGDTVSDFITLTNLGTASATGITAVNIAPPFSIVPGGTCLSTSNFVLPQLRPGYSNTYDIACTLRVNFTPSALGAFNGEVAFSFYNGEATVTSGTIILQGLGANLGKLDLITPTLGPGTGLDLNEGSLYMGAAALNTDALQIFTYRNYGAANATNISLSALSAPFSYTADTCSGATIMPNGTCQFTVAFHPTIRNYTLNNNLWPSIITLNFDDGLEAKYRRILLTATANNPPDITIEDIDGAGSYDYGDVAVNVATLRGYKIKNNGETAATGLSVSLLNISDMPYSIKNSNCQTSLSAKANCTFNVEFRPALQTSFISQINTIYSNNSGGQILPTTFAIRGNGVNPVAVMSTWNDIYAASDTDSGSVHLGWNAMTTPSAITFTKYNIYRAETPLPISTADLAAGGFLLASVTAASSSYYDTDPSLELGKSYYYTIRPIYGTAPETVVEVDAGDVSAQIKITIPPPNMSLVHRWISNIEQCALMARDVDKNNNFRCNYAGIDNKDGFLDQGYDLFVDRYETSVNVAGDGQSVPAVLPSGRLSQLAANTLCQTMEESINGSLYQKRLLRRTEQVVASSWPSTLLDADREKIENGTVSGACANTQTEIQVAGSKALCVSRYGIYDMIGNLWEWASDRTSNGIGVATSLDPDNTAIIGIFVGGINAGAIISNATCFSTVLGSPRPISGGVCMNDSMAIASLGTNKLEGDYYWPPIGSGGKGVRGGGGLGISVTDPFKGKSGRYTVDWYTPISPTTEVPLTHYLYTGGRCGFAVH